MKAESLFVSESHTQLGRRTYRVRPTEKEGFVLESRKDTATARWAFHAFLMSVFLPQGYPQSVSPDYLSYQIWDSIQAFASSISGGICTHSILRGAGVGDESASALAATVTWLLKDGTSMVGRIGFAWLYGAKLDTDCKKWRLFADVVNDVSMFADLMCGYFQSQFMLIACISGFLKSLVGVAGGCTRAALTQHQARRGNMADVSAKDGSQETLVNLLALLCNLPLIPALAQRPALTWALFALMTGIHLFSNYLAVKSVVIETFNEERFGICADHYQSEGKMLSVSEVNNKESVFLFNHVKKAKICLGTSFENFSQIIKRKSVSDLCKIMTVYENCHYLLALKSKYDPEIRIVYHKKATTLTKLESLYQAHYIIKVLKEPNYYQKSLLDIEIMSRKYTQATFEDFIKGTKSSGFRTDKVSFNTELWVADW